MRVIVAIHDVAHAELLIYPCLIVGICIVCREHVATVWVDDIVASHEVNNLILVSTLIGAEVDTAIEIDVFCELGGICREESVPCMVVE